MIGFLLRSHLRADRLEQYDLAHNQVPADVVAAIQSAGIRDWSIARDGTLLTQLIVAEDRRMVDRAMREQPAHWMRRMQDMTDAHAPSPEMIEVNIPWLLRR